MALEKKYLCDSCGHHVTPENGVIGDKEFTIEKGRGTGNKVFIQVSVGNLSLKGLNEDYPALCSACLSLTFKGWLETGENFIVV